MQDKDIARSLTEYITADVAIAVPAAPLTRDFPLIEGGVLDSLGLFKVIAFIEDSFAVRIAPEEIQFENFATIGAITRLVRCKQSQPSGSECG